jgi:hypothetical protein
MMTKLNILLFFTLISFSSCIHTQNDSVHESNCSIYQELSKYLDIKDAKFVLILNNDHVLIDTTVLNKINSQWLEKVNVLHLDPNQKDSKVATVEIYIRKRYISKTKKIVDKK